MHLFSLNATVYLTTREYFQISTDNLPVLKKPSKKATDEERQEFADLFDNSDDEDDEIRSVSLMD